MLVTLKKIVSWLLISALVNNPVYALYMATGLLFFTPLPAYADAFMDQAANGQTLGDALLNDYTTPTVNPATGTITLQNGLVAGQGIQQNELFQQIQPGSMDGIASSYGDSAAFGTEANNGIANLTTGTSTHAQAYQTLLGANTSMPDISNDPIWTVSDNVFSLQSPLITDLFAGCTKTATTSETSCDIHVPDIKTCKKTIGTQSCKVTRQVSEAAPNEKNIQLVSISDPPQLPPNANDIVFNNLLDTVNLTIGIPWDYDPGSGGCYYWEWTMNLSVTDPSKIISALLTHAEGDGGITVFIDGNSVWSNGNGACVHDSWTLAPNLSIKPYLTAGNHTITVRITSDDNDTPTVPDGGTNFVIKQVPDINESVTDFPAGCRERLFAAWPPVGTAPAVWTPGTSANDLASTEWWQCTDADYSRVFGSVVVTPEMFGGVLGQLYPGAPLSPPAPICYSAEMRLPGSVPLPCFTDINGYVQCPTAVPSTTGQTSCDPIVNNPKCAWQGEICAPGAVSPITGTCNEFIETYDCGISQPGLCDQTSVSEQTICDGAIRCMGGECVNQGVESNKDFAKAVSALQLLNQVQQQNGCDPAKGDCSLFAGEAMECQMADLSILGSVDCCNMPIGGSWIQYMQMAAGTWELADSSVELYALQEFGQQGVTSQGAWHLVTQNTVFGTPFNAVADGWTAITDTFTNMFDSVVQTFAGDVAANTAANLGTTFSLEAMRNTALNAMSTWVVENFGAQAGQALFSYSTVPVTNSATGAVVQQGVATGMSQMLASIINVIGIIYAIYQIAKMVVQLIFACTEEEVKLNMLKDQRMCTTPGEIGTYCSSKTLFGCIARKEAYCCFSSPFARIFQQQARPQLGMTFGLPEGPSCEGLTINQVSSLDFDKVDFSEWLNMMKGAGMLPMTGADANLMFSSGQVTTSNLFGAPPESAQDRLNKQLDGSNIDDIRQHFINSL